MVFRYLSTSEFSIDSVPLKFGDSRESVRMKIGGCYEESDKTISIGDSDAPLIQRRDIYDYIDSTGDFYFLNYDTNDQLTELEIQRCGEIYVISTQFTFDSELDWIAEELSKYSLVRKKGDGEYL